MHVALDPCFFTTKPKKLESCLLSMSSRDGIHGDLNFMALLTVEMIAKHGQISQKQSKHTSLLQKPSSLLALDPH
jgi:hypothetical protein